MKHLSLETFTDFKCIGSECPYTCCGSGWDIVIDKETDQFYRSVTGEMGERLKNCIQRDNGKIRFVLNESGNCPFLNEQGLCDIYINLGEEHLSDTCTYYPRYSFRSGDICFAGVSISCPVVAKTFLSHKEPLQIDFSEDEKPFNDQKNTDWELFNFSIRAFTCAVDIAQNRSLEIRERLSLILLFVHRFQSVIDEGSDPDALIRIFSDPTQYTLLIPSILISGRNFETKASFFFEIMSFFSRLEHVETRCPELSNLIKYFSGSDGASIGINQINGAYEWIDSKENHIWCENIIVYVLYRYFMRGFKNKDYYDKLMIGIVLLYNTIISVMAFYHIQHNHIPSTDYMILLTSHVSRLVEHSINFRDKGIDHFQSKDMFDLSFLIALIS